MNTKRQRKNLKNKWLKIFNIIFLALFVVSIQSCKNYTLEDYNNSLVIKKNDSTLEIILPKNKLLAVKLNENSNSGQIWELQRFNSKIFKLLKTDYDTNNKERVFYFSALQMGDCELVFRQQKIWQQNESELNNIKSEKVFFRIIVKKRR